MRKILKVCISTISLLILLSTPTSTVYAADSDIVLSEIMIDAAVSNEPTEWVEICNIGDSPVDVEGWTLEDNNGDSYKDTISNSMCPSDNCSIPAGECWLVTRTIAYLTTEFSNDAYGGAGGTCPGAAPSVNTSKTIELGEKIGGGLANSNDYLILGNGTDPVDCYSWDGSTTCANLTYVTGGNGVDANAYGSEAQPVSNVGVSGSASWANADGCGSAYSMTNTHDGGSPTAITLRSLAATSPQNTWMSLTLLVISITFGGIALRWQKRKN